MSLGSINDILILNTFNEEMESLYKGVVSSNAFPRTIALIRQEFPNIADEEIVHLVNMLVLGNRQNKKETVELVVTAPPSFKLRAKQTENVVCELLHNANNSILMTGYSVSEYVNDFLDLIIKKSQRGIFVKLFINKIDKQESIEKLIRYKGKFLKLYDYSNQQDKMSALHAKIISVDTESSLISSANLSYHGMSGNIEMGCFINSKNTAHKIDDIFKQLIFQGVFKEV